MIGARNGIIGDDFGTAIPETVIDEKELINEQKATKYSKSHEYKKLKTHWEERIKFYQQYLPDGRLLTGVNDEERGKMWLAANVIIAELNNTMNYYETSEELINQDV